MKKPVELDAMGAHAPVALVATMSVGGPQLATSQPDTTRGDMFEAMFTLTADATLTHDASTLGIHSQVFVLESNGNDAIAVTAPADPFSGAVGAPLTTAFGQTAFCPQSSMSTKIPIRG